MSAVELVEHFLDRIDLLNPQINAIVTLDADRARARATDMDNQKVPHGILWGVPFADKDLTHRQGVRTGFGSKTRAEAPPEPQSDPLAVALDDAGGISVGKSAVCEFGLSSYTRSDVLAPTANPFSLDHGAGGSSGGNAAAVAAGMLPFAPGNDGGGSVRIPAWTCGLVGHKPSRGLIPAGTGLESPGGLVVPGPLARSVDDAALLLDAMRGSGTTFRATGHANAPASFLKVLHHAPHNLTIGVTTASPWDDWAEISVDPEAKHALERVAATASALGHTVEWWDWRPPARYPEAFETLWSTSAVLLDVPTNRRHLLEPLTAHLVERGEGVSAAALAGALRFLATFETAVIRQFSAFDVVLTPGLATLPPTIDFYDLSDPVRNFRQQVQVTPFSSFVNVCGLPALALPVMAAQSGVPLGVQLIGQPGGDALVLQLAATLEAELGWRGTRPGLW
jgi:amidase